MTIKSCLFAGLLCLVFTSSAFALTVDPWTDGTSLNENSTAVSLSPNVVLSYDSDNGTNYALTGASLKGKLCYGVESGNQGVYQQAVALAAGPIVAADDNDAAANQYDNDDWVQVGQ